MRNHAQKLVSLILTLVGLMIGVTLMPGASRVASAQAVAPSWKQHWQSQHSPRWSHSDVAAQWQGSSRWGRGLCRGICNSALNSSEFYDPTTGVWSNTGGLNIARYGHAATLLPNGKVLVVGGFTTVNQTFYTISSAELYDAATGTWSSTAELNTARGYHTATLLPSGRVLVTGGFDVNLDSSNSAELYDPATGVWSSTGNLNDARGFHTETLLLNGNVLVVGGFNCVFFGIFEPCVSLNSAELYDPATRTWSSTGTVNVLPGYHTATLLPSGKVLLVAGGAGNNGSINRAELYDPVTGAWSNTGNLNSGRTGHTATLLPNGKILIAAGFGDDFLKTSELYDTTTGAWSLSANLDNSRGGHTATLLPNGKVLVAGGGGGRVLNSAELYDPGISSTPNQIDDAQFFVRQHYLDFLNREPDAGGLAYWTDQITQCSSDARCVHERRIGVSAAFFVELEFQQTGYVVYRLYRAAYGTMPNAPSRANLNFSQFMADRAQLVGGQGLQQSTIDFANTFATRPEFKLAYPDSMSHADFVNTLFNTANLMPFTLERQDEMTALINGTKSRAQVLLDVVEIQEFDNREYNPAFVLMQFFGYLRRDPDQSGYDFWLDVVNNREPNNYRAMVCAFITSAEYQLRFGAVVTRTNADCSQ